MTTDFKSADDAPRPDGSELSEGLGPDAEWALAWFKARYEAEDLFVDGPECLTLDAAADLVRDARQMQSDRIKAALAKLGYTRKIEELIAQRDALLEALKEIVDAASLSAANRLTKTTCATSTPSRRQKERIDDQDHH